MKKILWGLMLMLALPVAALAQYDKMLDVLEDTEAEMADGKLTLRFFDAKTGAAVSDAAISIPEIGDFTSDLGGKVGLDKMADGKHSFRFTKEGYISATYEFEVIAETIFYNRFSVCPVSELGALCIVLDWDRSPSDLDLHLVKEGIYHISYRDKALAADGSAKLDRDDRDGYGPETITLSKTDPNANYTCYVFDFSDSNSARTKKLSRSKAVLRVYNNNKMLHNFYIDRNQTGNKWNVFNIRRGEIEVVNKFESGE